MLRRPVVDNRGFTLTEIIVVTMILVAIGVAISMMLRSALDVWRRGEKRRELYDRAQHIFDHYFNKDLTSVYCHLYDSSLDNQGWMIADRGPVQNMFRIRFLKADARRSQYNQLEGYALKYLRPPTEGIDQIPNVGGISEVVYVHVPDPDGVAGTLYRAEIPAQRSTFAGIGAGDDWFPASPAALNLIPVSSNVLYFEMLFWGEDSQDWTPRPGRVPAETCWDSTRGRLTPDAGLNSFRYHKSPASLKQYHDDVFPERVKVTLVLRPTREASVPPKVAVNFQSGDRTLVLNRAENLPSQGYVKIGREWMTYDAVNGNQLRVTQRGVRNTVAATHAPGTDCEFGETFVQVFDLPVYRYDQNP